MDILCKSENMQNKSLSIIYETYKEVKKHLIGKAREFIRLIGS